MRVELGMRQGEVSRLTGVPVKVIGNYESGAVNCPELYEAKLLKIYKSRKNESKNRHTDRVDSSL